MDYYDPEDDKYLLIESVYRDLYSLRESHGMRIDINPTTIISDLDILTNSKIVVEKY